MKKFEQQDNRKKGRFVLYDDEVFAGEITYAWSGEGKIIVDHTGVEEQFGGKGYGKLLVMKIVEFAREKHIKIVPVCSFAQKVFDRDQSIQDVKF
ncbi:MAG: N-acetyltransferase [Bacteroidales bacterium]|nr:N-acetyltransferase [Bacteroidales bacterium]